MIVEHTNEFDQSIKKLKDKVAKERLNFLIEKLKKAQTLHEISNVLPVKNHPMIYRIKTGNYRLFVLYKNGNITILLLEYIKRSEKTYLSYR